MRPRRRVLTPSGWGLLALVAAALLAGALVLLTGGCSAPEAESPIPTPVAPADVPRGTERHAERPEAIPPQAERYARTLARAWQHYFDLAEPASIGFAQVHQESRWKATARSPVGASGLGQFMPATADWIHELLPADVQAECGAARGCPEDPRWALEALAKFDYLLHRGAGWAAPAEDRWAVALAGYNGGEGWIRRERAAAAQRGVAADGWFDKLETVCLRSAAACRENREYPRVILRRWRPLYAGWLGD